MKNKTFLNGANFINTVMARMTTGQEVSLPGYDKVLTEIVDPGLDLLSSSATVVNVQGNDVDIFSVYLFDEKFEVHPFAAQAAVIQIRQYNRLVERRNQMMTGYAQRPTIRMVGTEGLSTGRPARKGGRRASGINGGVNEEVVVAERFLRIFEDYEDVDLGWLNFLKYRMLLMARDALEAKYGDNCNEATEEKDVLLYGTIMDNIQNIREEHPEYMHDPRCDEDCMNCPYFVIDCDEDDDEGRDGSDDGDDDTGETV